MNARAESGVTFLRVHGARRGLWSTCPTRGLGH